jgi:hypothetical protein
MGRVLQQPEENENTCHEKDIAKLLLAFLPIAFSIS